MKKIFLPIFILTWTLVLTGLWIIQPSNSTSSVLEYIFVGVICLFFLLGGFFGYARMKRKKQGLPEEDELSRKIAQKSAAISFYLSVVLWLTLIFIQSHFLIDIKWLLSSGMIGMAIIFFISWLIINNQGIDEK
ncbi:MAG: hypothetical protein J7K53_12300 [Bacteroidales bacterium]|nr:hypothetical protein [Bacteroidales bacterium]